MDPEQWSRVRDLFHEALDHPPDERRNWLIGACPDLALRAEVDSLLANSDDKSFLEAPALDGLRGAIERAGPGPEPNPSEALVAGLVGGIIANRYRVERVLGRGGHAIVFLSADLRIADRPVVVKVLNHVADHRAWLQKRFREEIEILGRIRHPGIVGIRDCGELPTGDPYLVMEYVDGVTLRERLRSPIELAEVAEIILGIGSALAAAHRLGVAHRDLKPENIMLEQSSPAGQARVKLIDFGIAQMHRAESGGTTTVLMIAGTTRYMAPEQFFGVSGPASDIYSFGIVCFEMLTGSPPYTSTDALHLASEQRRNLIHAIVARSAGIPVLAKPLIAAALAFDSSQRPADAESFGGQLATALQERPPDRLQRLSRRMKRDRRTIATVLTASVLILAALSFLGRFLWFGSHIESLVEHTAGDDPFSEDFTLRNDVSATVVYNDDATAMEAWRILTHTQGHYLHGLNWWQKRSAIRNGWRLTAIVRLHQGQFSTGADFVGAGARFFFGGVLEGSTLVARVWTNQVPRFAFRDAQVRGNIHAYHTYEMSFDPATGAADLKVDGIAVLSGYRGLHQFQDNLGVSFGSERWKSPAGEADFKLVRFEILGQPPQ